MSGPSAACLSSCDPKRGAAAIGSGPLRFLLLSRFAPSATLSKSLRLHKPACGPFGAFGPFVPLRVLASCSRVLSASDYFRLKKASLPRY